MPKTIVVKLTGYTRPGAVFTIKTPDNNVLSENLDMDKICSGVALIVDDSVNVVIVEALYRNKVFKKVFPVGQIYKDELAFLPCRRIYKGSVWVHGKKEDLYNSFYGFIEPYVLEYPFFSSYQDEVIRAVEDYTRAYEYIGKEKIGSDKYFNKAIIYNDTQSTGILELEKKPFGNLNKYMSYPVFKDNSKVITYTKSDNIYKYNTFWDIVKSKEKPLFLKNKDGISVFKVINEENMDYSNRSYQKYRILSKDTRVRHILDNVQNLQLINQFVLLNTQPLTK